MSKTCKEIAEDIQELKRNLQQSRLFNYYVKTQKSEKLNNEATVDSKEKDRNSSRTEAGTN